MAKTAKKTQEELLAILDHYSLSGKKVLIAGSDKPDCIEGLMPDLVSRLNEGLVLEIEKPDVESRQIVVAGMLRGLGLKIEESAVAAIAESVGEDIREISGVVNRINFMFNGRRDEIGIGELGQYIKLKSVGAELASPEEILGFVSRKFGIKIEVLRSKSRSRDVVRARDFAMAKMRGSLGLPFAEIGRIFNFRDHTSVMAGVKRSGGA